MIIKATAAYQPILRTIDVVFWLRGDAAVLSSKPKDDSILDHYYLGGFDCLHSWRAVVASLLVWFAADYYIGVWCFLLPRRLQFVDSDANGTYHVSVFAYLLRFKASDASENGHAQSHHWLYLYLFIYCWALRGRLSTCWFSRSFLTHFVAYKSNFG